MASIASFFDGLRAAIAVLRAHAIPLGIAGFAGLFLALPGQMHEIYRLIVEDIFGSDEATRRATIWIAVASVSLVLAAIASLAFIARVLAVANRAALPVGSRFWDGVVRWMPVCIAAGPLLALAYGLYSAGAVSQTIDAEDMVRRYAGAGYDASAAGLTELLAWTGRATTYLHIAAAACAAAAVAVFPLSRLIYRRSRAGAAFYDFSCRPYAAVATLLFVTFLIGLFATFRVELPQAIGTVGVFCAFIVCLSFVTCQLSVWSRLSGLPLIAMLIAGALIFSIVDWNDNHELRRLDTSGRPPAAVTSSAAGQAGLPSAEESFLAWYRVRAGKTWPEKARFPVYVVAAQGGGIYAAAQTLLFMTTMQAACERFADHVFAISSVSGGSVGAAMYSGLAERFTRRQERCPDIHQRNQLPSKEMGAALQAARSLLIEDYLSPLVGAALFPDFLQRFLPFSIPSWSRARALEQALEAGFDRIAPPGAGAASPAGLRGGVVAAWSPQGLRPALLLNTTEASTGRRRVVAPFTFGESAGNDLRLLPLSRDNDIPLSSAAVASARFPWLTPAAWYRGRGRDPSASKYRLVDGGYFENSGVATAIDLIESLQEIATRHALPVDFHLIALTSGGFAEDRFNGLSEFLSPIVSLLNSRRARTYATIDLADRRLGPIDPAATGAAKPLAAIRRLQRVEIRDLVTPLPLGWRLSQASAFQIFRQSGLVRTCDPNERFEQTVNLGPIGSADCVKRLIYHQLRGDDLAEALSIARSDASDLRKTLEQRKARGAGTPPPR